MYKVAERSLMKVPSPMPAMLHTQSDHGGKETKGLLTLLTQPSPLGIDSTLTIQNKSALRGTYWQQLV